MVETDLLSAEITELLLTDLVFLTNRVHPQCNENLQFLKNCHSDRWF
jgi:hypothetical protein